MKFNATIGKSVRKPRSTSTLQGLNRISLCCICDSVKDARGNVLNSEAGNTNFSINVPIHTALSRMLLACAVPRTQLSLHAPIGMIKLELV